MPKPHLELGNLTPPENLGYLPEPRRDNWLIAVSLTAFAALIGGLFALMGGSWLMALVSLVVLVGAAVAAFKLSIAADVAFIGWLEATYGVHFTPLEAQQLREGKVVHRGDSWWVADDSPWIVGVKLLRTTAAD